MQPTLKASWGSFLQERRGNVSILFGLSLVPMIGLAGLGVDYGLAFGARTKLDNAADAAALAAVATAKAYVAANVLDANTNTNAIAAGLDRARRAFTANAGSVIATAVPTPAITLTRTGQTFASTVSYTTTTTAQFGRMFGQPTLTVGGSSAASADVPSYLDFYLMVDESGSMGIPTQPSDQSLLASVSQGCQFACHFPDSYLMNAGNGQWGYRIATTGKTYNGKTVLSAPIQLRAGAVNSAICSLLTRAASPAVPMQYRVGIYPFIDGIGTLAGLSTDIASLQTIADCASSSPMKLTALLDTNATQFYTGGDPSTGTGSGGTHFEVAMPGVQALVAPIGDGSTALKSKPFVFLITDGMQNNQHYAYKSGSTYLYPGNPNNDFQGYKASDGRTPITSYWDGSSPQPFNASLCSGLKSAGVTVSVLYIPYAPLTVGMDNQGEVVAVNNAIAQSATNLQACATSGFFYTASSQTDITTALNAMFNQAIQVAHLSK